MHLAAESHVDRSISDPMAFVRTNVVGTVVLLQEAAKAWQGRDDVRFHHVSTDEVFGSLGPVGAFTEDSPYAPNSPYSASKAASDHFVRAWGETYGLPIVLTNTTNNYGPYPVPREADPGDHHQSLVGDPVPIYGKGANVRDWLFVEDHCDASAWCSRRARSAAPTESVGGRGQQPGLAGMVLDPSTARPVPNQATSRALMEFVGDRPGHDFRYAMDTPGFGRAGLGTVGVPRGGIERTVRWYLEIPIGSPQFRMGTA